MKQTVMWEASPEGLIILQRDQLMRVCFQVSRNVLLELYCPRLPKPIRKITVEFEMLDKEL